MLRVKFASATSEAYIHLENLCDTPRAETQLMEGLPFACCIPGTPKFILGLPYPSTFRAEFTSNLLHLRNLHDKPRVEFDLSFQAKQASLEDLVAQLFHTRHSCLRSAGSKC